MRIIYGLAILLVLAGCARQEQIVAHQSGQQAAQQAATNRAQIAARQVAGDDARCRQSHGAPGSNAYLACRVNLASNRAGGDGQAEANR